MAASIFIDSDLDDATAKQLTHMALSPPLVSTTNTTIQYTHTATTI